MPSPAGGGIVGGARYHGDVTDRDLAALDAYPLSPRLLHGVEDPHLGCHIAGRELPAPLLPRSESWRDGPPAWPLVQVEADAWLSAHDRPAAEAVVVRLPPAKMGELVPLARRLGELEPAAVVLDLTPLAASEPFGDVPWRPRQREELAELRAASGRATWLDGICSPADAEIAAEAGLDGVVVRSAVGRHVGGPAVAEVLPELLDGVAGMLGVLVAGPVRDGIDVFRYLALGAEGILTEPGADVRRLSVELAYAMRLTGCATLEDVGYEALFAPLWEEGP